MALKPLETHDNGEPPDSGGTARRRYMSPQPLRKVIAISALVAFAINFFLAQDIMTSARESEASAVQVIQIWVPHIYYAILITGVTVALYVWTRAND